MPPFPRNEGLNMLPDKAVKCPATGFAKSCFSIVSKGAGVCPKWINVKGSNPQSGEVFDRWGCSDTFMPMLLIENPTQQAADRGCYRKLPQ
jgi:hypothetical protein